MKIKVNGETRVVTSKNISDTLTELGFGDAKVATAVNEEFVATTLRQTYELTEGDRLEILAPMQGG
jgi:sulfur carrier protein